ncbi:hypothetical protein [Demequina iriomotensis]|uniref:hypothetical protein n=1 Tax=Demequina iriomotensis TaxID=1536641 RepID=UPI000781392C|nr:hypothetical protein [Demequina iriomotensis]
MSAGDDEHPAVPPKDAETWLAWACRLNQEVEREWRDRDEAERRAVATAMRERMPDPSRWHLPEHSGWFGILALLHAELVNASPNYLLREVKER